MGADDARQRRLTPAYLDEQRPLLVRGCVLFGAITALGLLMIGWDLVDAMSSPALALLVLALVFGASVFGAFMFGRMRARTIREGRDGRAISKSPGWLGMFLAVIPGFVIVGVQALGRSSPLASNIAGLLAVYGLSLGFGLSLGLVIRT